jgi:hypothetical protein
MATRLGDNRNLLLRGYGPLVAILGTLMLVATLAPSVGGSGASTGIAAGGTGSGGIAASGPGTGAAGGSGAGATGATGAGAAGTSGAGATGSGAAGEAGGQAASAPVGASGGCPDRQMQVPDDPYSPPCVAFSGANAGATARGVTDEEILLSFRMTNEAGFQETLAQLSGGTISDDIEDVLRTAEGLAEYFSSTFQFYGRKLKIVPFEAKGAAAAELLGGGHAEAEADAITVADQIGAFAEFQSITFPFVDALTARGVITLNPPYPGRAWHEDRAPYSWNAEFVTCSVVSETQAEYLSKRVAYEGATAVHAGAPYTGQPRKMAALFPENPEYTGCDSDPQYEPAIPVTDFNYRLDLTTASNQAASMVAKLKDGGYTTVVCACDPIFPVFLTAKATEQGYNPEWVVTGTAMTDTDIMGQLYDQAQWRRAWGVSYLGSPEPRGGSYGYFAFKAARPNEEPSTSVDLLYYRMYALAIGIQGAGPNLTPETFQQGMFAYPGSRQGPFGTWKFGPGHRQAIDDGREVWYSPDAVSSYNGQAGAYIEINPGTRYLPGTWPSGEAPAFQG